MAEKYTLNWQTFSEHLQLMFKDLYEEEKHSPQEPHLKEHGLGYTQYMKEHMKKGSGLITANRVPASSISSSSSKAAPTQRRVQPPVPATPAGPRTRSQSKLSPVQPHVSTIPATPRAVRTPVQTSPDLVLPPSPPITPPAIKKEPQEILPYFAVKQEPMEVVEAVSPGLVLIQCDLCFKVFKHNMQLRGHKRKSH